MSDRWPVALHIGGNIPRHLIQGLVVALEESGLTPDDWDTMTTFELLVQADTHGSTAGFVNYEAAGGLVDPVKLFCLEHGIWYDLHSDAYMSYDAENEYFRGEYRFAGANDGDMLVVHNGQHVPIIQTCAATQDGSDLVPCFQLEELIERMDDEGAPPWAILEEVRDLISHIDLPPLRMVGVDKDPVTNE